MGRAEGSRMPWDWGAFYVDMRNATLTTPDIERQIAYSADVIAIYHRNADKLRVEFFCEMDSNERRDARPFRFRKYWGFGSERVIPGCQTVE
jgi:hypothetical protein